MGALSIVDYPRAGCETTEVDLSTDADVVVSASPCILLGIHVNVGTSAHTVNLVDGSTTKIVLAASLELGSDKDYHGARFDTDLKVNVDNAATGKLLFFWLQQ